MRTLWYILPAVLFAGCATKQPVAIQPPPVAPVAAVVPTKAVETRYDVRGYREAANPSIRHEAHAVYRRTIVPANAPEDTGTVPRTAYAPASHAPLSGDAELAAELATQKAITAELRAMQSSMSETERRMQAQYAQLVRQSTEAAKLRERLEADRSRLRSGVPPAASEPVAANATAPTEAKW